MKKLSLIIEKSKDGKFWGRVTIEDDLIIESAASPEGLEKKMKKLLYRFHNIQPGEIRFEPAYDLTALFDRNDFLNISAIALRSGINPGLMRQYAAGLKYPSAERAKAIEQIVNELGRELARIKVAVIKDRSVPKGVKRKLIAKNAP